MNGLKPDTHLTRRDFLKMAVVGAGGALLASCGPQSKPQSEPQAAKPEAAEVPDNPENLIVVEGADAKNIFQTKIGDSGGILAAVEAAPADISKNAYALTWFKAGRTDAVIFHGESGFGKQALLVLSNLFNEGKLTSPELEPYNPNQSQPEDEIVFGKTNVVDYNFSKLRDGKLQSVLNQYLDVIYGYNPTSKTNTLTLTQVKRVDGQWQSAVLSCFTRPETGGDWTLQS